MTIFPKLGLKRGGIDDSSDGPQKNLNDVLSAQAIKNTKCHYN